MISVWKCFKKPPLLKRKVFGRHSFKTNRGLYNPSYTLVTHCNTDTPATEVQFSSPQDWLIQQQPCALNCRWNGQDELQAKRDRTVSGCIFILLHSHRASWKRLSKNNCQNDDKPQYHMYQHASPQRKYIVSAFHIQSGGKSMNITFTPARLPHRHHQRIWKSLLPFI